MCALTLLRCSGAPPAVCIGVVFEIALMRNKRAVYFNRRAWRFSFALQVKSWCTLMLRDYTRACSRDGDTSHRIYDLLEVHGARSYSQPASQPASKPASQPASRLSLGVDPMNTAADPQYAYV